MIAYIKGKLADISSDRIIVEHAGIGIEIHVPHTVLATLPCVGEEVFVHTYFKVSEDAMRLYGFHTKNDVEMFTQLIGVGGIGPKGAIAILSCLSPDDLRMAIIANDAKAIAKAQGIGVKTAQRVILELKDKVHLEDVIRAEKNETIDMSGGIYAQVQTEAIEALVGLGYSPSQAMRALKQLTIGKEDSVETILKHALKTLALF